MSRPAASTVAPVAQLVLALALLAAVIGWRDPDAALRWTMPAIGAVGLGLAVAFRRQAIGRWIAIAIDLWFFLFGVMLSMSVASQRAGVSGQFDPGPDVITHLTRLESWLDPAVQGPVAAVFLIVGLAGAIAAARTRRTLA